MSLFVTTTNMTSDVEKSFNMTAVVILVIPLTFFNNGSRKLILLAQNINFLGLPILRFLLWVDLKSLCFVPIT